MADYSRKRFDQIKRQNPGREGCLLLAADDEASVFWSYDDDAVALSDDLEFFPQSVYTRVIRHGADLLIFLPLAPAPGVRRYIIVHFVL